MDNELKVNGTQKFMGIDIPIIEGGFGENQKVILAKTIAEIHNQPLKKINQLINDNIDEFEFGIDILDLKSGYLKYSFLKMFYSKQSIANSKNIYLLSETGYLKFYSLIRNKDELILRYILNDYFKSNRIVSYIKNKEIVFRSRLSYIFKEFGISYEFQFPVEQYFIDIYLPDLCIAIEYDENEHRNYTYENHKLRQKNIENKLQCKFIRVSDDYPIDKAIAIVIKKICELRLNQSLKKNIA